MVKRNVWAFLVLAMALPVLATDEEIVTEDGRSIVIQRSEGRFLGVSLAEVTSEQAKRLNLPREQGAVITQVSPDSPAQQAGLRTDDVVIAYNDRPVATVREFQRLVAETPSGRKVPLTIIRGGASQTLTATLNNREPGANFRERMVREFSPDRFASAFESAFGTADAGNRRRLGVSLQPLSTQLADYFGTKDGLLVTEVRPDTAAARAGLKAGDVLTAANGETLTAMSDLSRLLNRTNQDRLTLTLVRNRREQSLTVQLDKRPQSPKPPTAPKAPIL